MILRLHLVFGCLDYAFALLLALPLKAVGFGYFLYFGYHSGRISNGGFERLAHCID